MIEHFDVGHNGFSDKIPPKIGRLTRLQVLSLEDNKFSGQLPSEVGKLSNLHSLYVADNRFTGTIPMEVCGLWNESLANFGSNSTGAPCGDVSTFYGGLTCPSQECCPDCPI